jgi:hypothetical protein
MVSITWEILPEICFFSKAKMYRYHQIDGMVAAGDVNKYDILALVVIVMFEIIELPLKLQIP